MRSNARSAGRLVTVIGRSALFVCNNDDTVSGNEMDRLAVLTIAWKKAATILVTLVVAVLAALLASSPSATEVLQFDRAEILAGEVWRLATCHLTHWNVEHLQWDLLMFVVLGAACEMRSPRRMWLCTGLAAASVSLLVFYRFPGCGAYRGLSGIDTALFVLLGIDLMREARRQRQPALFLAIGGLLLGFLAKTAYEAVTGHAFFVDQSAAGFDLLVWDHIVAAAVGAAIAFGAGMWRRPDQRWPHRVCVPRARVGQVLATQ
jgi:rhomboid family GlyGly-CTERM serine protease